MNRAGPQRRQRRRGSPSLAPHSPSITPAAAVLCDRREQRIRRRASAEEAAIALEENATGPAALLAFAVGDHVVGTVISID